MKIGIADCELLAGNDHKFPNLALMKISGFYKAQGHDVELLSSWNNASQYDKIYSGKVFTSTSYCPPHHPNIITGGTGFYFDRAPALPEEIEHHTPDYSLYRDYITGLPRTTANQRESYLKTSIGYTTRGCIRGCKFCVNQNSRNSILWSPLEEFVSRDLAYICLNDDNILANQRCLDVFDKLDETGKRWYYKQGLDERLLNVDRAKRLGEDPEGHGCEGDASCIRASGRLRHCLLRPAHPQTRHHEPYRAVSASAISARCVLSVSTNGLK